MLPHQSGLKKDASWKSQRHSGPSWIPTALVFVTRGPTETLHLGRRESQSRPTAGYCLGAVLRGPGLTLGGSVPSSLGPP